MNSTLKNAIALSLIPQIILVKLLGSFPEFIETYYSKGIYPFISGSFRTLLGWIPFSVGDIIYAILILLAGRFLIVDRKKIRARPRTFIRDLFFVLAVGYFTFHLAWGFNYYRQPIAKALAVNEKHSYAELINFTETLIEVSNKVHKEITSDRMKMVEIPYSQKEIFEKTVEGYKILEGKLPALAYEQPSIKTSVFSTLLSYMGYGGYLNPFTNEAQVNGKLPNFRFPVVAAHEIGHQIGYSAENETNFVGYLVTLSNQDPYFQYSALTYALSYCLAEINRRDKQTFQVLYARVNEGIKKNYRAMNTFWETYENPLEPVFKAVFNSFLKANNQAQGIKSYSLVVSLLVSYHQERPL